MTVRVPFVDLRRQVADLRAEVDAAIAGVLDRGDFIQGHAVAEFERAFAAYCGAAHCVGVASGTAALTLALRALGVGPGSEVITAANTFAATAFAILEAGGTPVLVDVDPETQVLTAAAVDAVRTPRTRVVIPVHLYGRLAPMPDILAVTRTHGIALLEDAAQAHGAQLGHTRAGAFGDAGAFSFYPSKNLGAFGDGGAVTAASDDTAAALRRLCNLGAVRKYVHEIAAPNERLDTLQAAVLAVKLRHLDAWNAARQRAAAAYADALDGLPLRCPAPAPAGSHVYHLYVVTLDDPASRDGLQAFLNERGIQTGLHYPIPLPELAPLQPYVDGPERFPVTMHLARAGLSLPMFPEITPAQIAAVADGIRAFYA